MEHTTRIEVGNWTLEKANSGTKQTDKLLPVRMIANRLKVDKENQEIVPQAFNKATTDWFVRHGIIDWHHQSVLGKTPDERAHAIIGKPYDFAWETEGGRKLPVVYANLTKAHPIVRDSIVPHLEAEQPVFAASVGGSIRKAKAAIDPETRKQKEQIMEIAWDCLSVAAAPYVISAGSDVSLVKAETGDSLLRFSGFDMLESSSFSLDEILQKALTVGAGTNSAALTGADALRSQQPPKKRKRTELIADIADGLRSDRIGPSREGVRIYLKAQGLAGEEIDEFLPFFLRTVKAVISN